MGQNQTGVVISGHSERISPGVIRSEVGRPERLGLTTGRPTLDRITPGEILSERPEITTPVWFWPKFLENHTPVNSQKFSGGLLCINDLQKCKKKSALVDEEESNH